MSDTLAAQITKLTADVAAQASVTASAITLINGISTQIAAAVAAASAAGATPQQLADLDALHASLSNSTAELASAVTASGTAPPTAA